MRGHWYENDFLLKCKKLIFTRKVLHLASFINWEFLELGNRLLRTLRQTNSKRISWIYFMLQRFVFLTCEKHKMVVKTTNVTHTIGTFKFLVQFSQLFFLFKRPYCRIFACISVRNNISMPNSIVWENGRHYAVPPLVSSRNEVWETSAEVPYWWRITTQIRVVLLIGRATCEICFNQSETLPRSCLLSDTSWVWNFCTRFSDVISRRNQWWRSEISAVSQATVTVM